MLGQKKRLVRKLVAVGLELALFGAIFLVMKLLKALVAEETRVSRSKFVFTSEPHSTSITNAARMLFELGEEHKPRISLFKKWVNLGVKQPKTNKQINKHN